MASGLQLEVAHAVLHVHDVERMIDFYTQTLGFEVTDRGPLGPAGGAEIVFLSQTARHHHQLAFVTGRGTPDPSNNLHHVAFRSAGGLASGVARAIRAVAWTSRERLGKD